jgi:hypothetical protein
VAFNWNKLWYKAPSNVNQNVDSFGGYRPSQPSQKYPFQPISPPRVDNKNQPWYGANSRAWGIAPDDIQFNDAAVTQTNGQDNYQVGNTWKFLGNWFGGITAKSNLNDTSQIPQQMGRLNMNDQSGWVLNNGKRGYNG